MRINPIPANPIPFGYNSVLKDEFKSNPEMREHVKVGLYGGILKKNDCTLEHVRPHSKGGPNALSNFALATKENNGARGNSPLPEFLTKDMFTRYIEQFKGWTAHLFDNEKYIENLTETVKSQGVDLGETVKEVGKHLNIKG